ncbi:isopenicillin N synthase family dioxygenase [Halotalea alkalilenta]|uniref:isopenicillin N synthase family dioxygenase n=1 Tax=Halotalea alkalilenta TaxID=376489 RepID=UPI000482568F|nr:2-oxoglutarate and iron-dependent oxygenase domain-containing protein [Halotalea alkalilenta]
MQSLPLIAVTELAHADPARRHAAAAQLGRASREVGFFLVAEHSVPRAAIDAAFADARAFFAQPLADKQQLSIKRSPHNRGYVAMADERLDPKAGFDRKEAFNLGLELDANDPDIVAGAPFRGLNFWPTALPGWRERMLGYFDHCLELGRLIHRGFAIDLGLDEEFFAPHLTAPIATLRLLHYPAAIQAGRHDAGAGEHTDYGDLTLLATDGVPGLEVRTRDGEWLEGPSIPGTYVCNIGDCLMRWSNDIYLSTPHRVRAPTQERYSIAFFMEPNPETLIDPRQIAPDQAPRYAPVHCADYLKQRLDATYQHRAGA